MTTCAARKAARRSYEFVSADDFDEEAGTRFNNGRAALKDDFVEISREIRKVDLNCNDEYYTLVVIGRFVSEGLRGAVKAIKKWPRVRPYWKRVRRRICENCAGQVALTEPRYLVCSGCGDARYCSVACQHAHWAYYHQQVCPAGQPGWNAAVDSR